MLGHIPAHLYLDLCFLILGEDAGMFGMNEEEIRGLSLYCVIECAT